LLERLGENGLSFIVMARPAIRSYGGWLFCRRIHSQRCTTITTAIGSILDGQYLFSFCGLSSFCGFKTQCFLILLVSQSVDLLIRLPKPPSLESRIFIDLFDYTDFEFVNQTLQNDSNERKLIHQSPFNIGYFIKLYRFVFECCHNAYDYDLSFFYQKVIRI